MKKKYLLISLVAVAQYSFSQQFDTLKTVLITATKIEQSIEKSGRSISIITADEISKSTATTFDDLLRLEAGINLNNRGGFGVQSDIGIRGSTFSQVLIMVDNMRLNDPLTGHLNNILPVALSEIGRIEIIRGPAAVAYGSDAVGGMIHIKTKTYLKRQPSEGLESNGSVSVGQYGLLNNDLTLGINNNKFFIGGGMKNIQSKGQTFVNPNFRKNNAADTFFQTDFNLQTYSLSLAYLFNRKWTLNARFGADLRDFNAKYFYTASTFDESREQVQTLWGQSNIIYTNFKKAGDLIFNRSLEINLGYRKTNDDFLFNPAFAANVHTMQKFGININKNYEVNEQNNFALGIQVENREIVSSDRGNHKNLDGGLYLIYHRSFNNDLNITFGQRFAYNDNYGMAYLPQLSIAQPLTPKLVLSASGGKSIRAGDFTERFVSNKIDSVLAGRNLGNPDLTEERSVAIDGGLTFKPNQKNQLSATYFHRWSKDLIDYSLTNSSEIKNLTNVKFNTDYLYAKNISVAETNGIELTYNYLARFKDNSAFNAGINYTYIHTQAPVGNLSKYISNHPTENLGINLGFQKSILSLNLNGNYIKRDAQQITTINAKIPADYIVINGKLSVALKPNLQVFVQAINLGDVSYQEILGSPMPRKWLMGGVSWNI